MNNSKVQTIQGYKMLVAIGVITVITSIYGLTKGEYLVGVTMTCIGSYLVYSNVMAIKIENNRK